MEKLDPSYVKTFPTSHQFKPNRPNANAKAMYEWATTLPAPIGIFIEADNDGNNSKPNINIINKNQNSTDSVNNNPTTLSRHFSCLQHPHSQFLQKLVYSPSFDHYNFLLPLNQIIRSPPRPGWTGRDHTQSLKRTKWHRRHGIVDIHVPR